jgi:hypothetical protein
LGDSKKKIKQKNRNRILVGVPISIVHTNSKDDLFFQKKKKKVLSFLQKIKIKIKIETNKRLQYYWGSKCHGPIQIQVQIKLLKREGMFSRYDGPIL